MSLAAIESFELKKKDLELKLVLRVDYREFQVYAGS